MFSVEGKTLYFSGSTYKVQQYRNKTINTAQTKPKILRICENPIKGGSDKMVLKIYVE